MDIEGAIIIIVLGYIFKKYYESRTGRFQVDSFILKIPLFGSLLLRSEVASLCDTLSTLIDSGIPLVDAIDRCISASGNERVKRCLSIVHLVLNHYLKISLILSRTTPKLQFLETPPLKLQTMQT